MSETLRQDRAYVTAGGHVLLGWERCPSGDGFPIRARLVDRRGRYRVEWYTDDGRWSAGGQRTELDLHEIPPPDRCPTA